MEIDTKLPPIIIGGITLSNYPIEELEQEVGASWIHLRKARKKASEIKQQLTENLSSLLTEEISTVVFGSLARNEFTEGSDLDWTLLIDGRANSQHLNAKHEIGEQISKLDLRKPGKEGTFGDLAFSHDIIHKIGGGDDTNKNTTQRILLLLESTTIGRNEAYNRVLKEILNRYVTEDWGLTNELIDVPRFLLNDIARYWRTVAVDFAYKRKERQGQGWAIRTIKLRMSRKLTFAAGLLTCFSCATNDELINKIKNCEEIECRPQIMVDHLFSLIRLTPLDRLAHIILPYKQLHPHVKQIIENYNSFIELLSNSEKRNHLENLLAEDVAKDRDYKYAREISHDFQNGLNKIFLEENGTMLYKLTKKYGVF